MHTPAIRGGFDGVEGWYGAGDWFNWSLNHLEHWTLRGISWASLCFKKKNTELLNEFSKTISYHLSSIFKLCTANSTFLMFITVKPHAPLQLSPNSCSTNSPKSCPSPISFEDEIVCNIHKSWPIILRKPCCKSVKTYPGHCILGCSPPW